MKGRIFGFHRRVWWPKCTPDSRSIFMETLGIESLLRFASAVFFPLGSLKARPGQSNSVGDVAYESLGGLYPSVGRPPRAPECRAQPSGVRRRSPQQKGWAGG